MLPQSAPRALSILLSAFFISPANAIVNIEEMRPPQQEDGWRGNVTLAISGDAGNTERSDFTASGQLFWQQAHVTRLIATSYSYGENSRNRNTNKGFIHLRHISQQTANIAFELFTQTTRNEFSRLSLRALVGGGARITLLKNRSDAIYLGTAIFYLSETLEPHPTLTDDGTEKFWRGNFYLALRYQINEQMHATSTTYYQPALANGNDYRILEEGNLRVRLANQLDLKLSIEITHDSEPPQSVKPTDFSYKTGVEYRF